MKRAPFVAALGLFVIGTSGVVRAELRRPDVVFLLLDTTRADRLSAWGYDRRTTPNLDRLAARGIRFARHFANAHATRPSMPQLMSGRYYLPNILREFRPNSHPRDWRFNRPDGSIALLPEMLGEAGYRLDGVSAHPWVSRSSRFGTRFDRFEEPEPASTRGHVDADVVVDKGLDLWRSRPDDRPTFLYLHFMDAHIPRSVPPGQLRFGVDDPSVRARFDSAGEPDFGDPWHEWDRSDARAFTPSDVAFFGAVYDTMLSRLDAEIGRLLTGVLESDPSLEHTLLIVVADHGEELGEHGRISHESSLDDAVQHIPLIVAGTTLTSGQVAWGLSENVDVVPTLLRVLDIPPPRDVRFDGRALIDDDGRVCDSCLRSTVVFAWEDYAGIRIGRRVVRDTRPMTLRSRCEGRYALLDESRHAAPTTDRRIEGATALLHRRLGSSEATFRRDRFMPPTEPFSVLPAFWELAEDQQLTCVRSGPETPRDAFLVDGWIWTGRGLTVQRGASSTPPLRLLLSVPAGDYHVELGVRDLPSPPRFFGMGRWLQKGVRRTGAKTRLVLGTLHASDHGLDVAIPSTMALHRHVVSVHLAPLGDHVRREAHDGGGHTPEMTERLRSLGYVE